MEPDDETPGDTAVTSEGGTAEAAADTTNTEGAGEAATKSDDDVAKTED